MYSQPGYLLRRLHQRSTAEFAAATNGLDITQVQFSILLVVQDHRAIDATRISELIGSDRTTVGQALLVLEKKGVIRRATGVHDRRTKILELTDEGTMLADRISDRVAGLGSAILRGLTGREYEVFMRLLKKLVAQQEGNDAIGQETA
jgi:DNA-binding MarR family transcriptional regulator